MSRTIVFSVTAALILTVLMWGSHARAWEFRLEGTYVHKWEYAASGGTAGFFGPHNVDSAAVAGNRNHQINFYPGLQFNDQTSSSLDTRSASQHMTIDPTIRINKAVSIHGQYYVGSWIFLGNGVGTGDLVGSEYGVSANPGVQNSISPGYWNWLRIKMDTPWGVVALGKRPSRWGTGLVLDGEDNSSSHSISLSVPYGPLIFGFSTYFMRPQGAAYYNEKDGSNIRRFNFAYGLKYRSGCVESGIVLGHVWRHRGGERQIGQVGSANSRDREDLSFGLYLKYQNGRVFLNTELREYMRRQRSYTLAGGAARSYSDLEFQSWVVEAGAFAGPAKLSFIVAGASGVDRRGNGANGFNGQGIFKDSRLSAVSANFSNTTMFHPYAYLMVYSYGLGQAANPRTGNGFFQSSTAFGARLDYALAANLNVYGSFFSAVNPYKGYGWGYIYPEDQGQTVANAGGVPGLIVRRIGGQTGQSPAIPDDSLGWEIGVGCDWNILEGFVFSVIGAYWKPGNWWKFACVSLDNPGWRNPTAANMWGINPNRSIDPVWGLEVFASFDF